MLKFGKLVLRNQFLTKLVNRWFCPNKQTMYLMQRKMKNVPSFSIDALNPPILASLVDVLSVTNIWLRVDEISVWLWVSAVIVSIISEELLPPSYIVRNSFSSYLLKIKWDLSLSHNRHLLIDSIRAYIISSY